MGSEKRPLWLVAGGSGYIGTHVVSTLAQEGFAVLAVDDEIAQERCIVHQAVEYADLDVSRATDVDSLLARTRPQGIVHLAARRDARESTRLPALYQQNERLTNVLVQSAHTHGVRGLIFSSSCSVYGSQNSVSIESPVQPMSPYARAKLNEERTIRQQWRGPARTYAILRLFNVIGAANPLWLDQTPDALLVRIRNALLSGSPLQVYGNDFETADGTCIREYVSVQDVAQAVANLAHRCGSGERLDLTLNVSSGEPLSVLQIVRWANDLYERHPNMIQFLPRQPGDPASITSRDSCLSALIGAPVTPTKTALLQALSRTDLG